ncbi:MAG: hypothetical protein PHC33_04620 [Candidatus Omnitrophica bacterium]|nr:hypothetical protein [Candidatus Omnitrophota bacterium]
MKKVKLFLSLLVIALFLHSAYAQAAGIEYRANRVVAKEGYGGFIRVSEVARAASSRKKSVALRFGMNYYWGKIGAGSVTTEDKLDNGAVIASSNTEVRNNALVSSISSPSGGGSSTMDLITGDITIRASGGHTATENTVKPEQKSEYAQAVQNMAAAVETQLSKETNAEKKVFLQRVAAYLSKVLGAMC